MGNLATGFKNMVRLITSDSKFCTAIVLHEEGKWKEAEEMYREALQVMSRVLGEEHPDTLIWQLSSKTKANGRRLRTSTDKCWK